jgi:hypothetical protein
LYLFASVSILTSIRLNILNSLPPEKGAPSSTVLQALAAKDEDVDELEYRPKPASKAEPAERFFSHSASMKANEDQLRAIASQKFFFAQQAPEAAEPRPLQPEEFSHHQQPIPDHQDAGYSRVVKVSRALATVDKIGKQKDEFFELELQRAGIPFRLAQIREAEAMVSGLLPVGKQYDILHMNPH